MLRWSIIALFVILLCGCSKTEQKPPEFTINLDCEKILKARKNRYWFYVQMTKDVDVKGFDGPKEIVPLLPKELRVSPITGVSWGWGPSNVFEVWIYSEMDLEQVRAILLESPKILRAKTHQEIFENAFPKEDWQ